MKPHLITVQVTSGSQVAAILEVADVISITQSGSTQTATNTTKKAAAYTKKKYPEMTLPELVLSHFRANPKEQFHTSDITKLIKKYGFKSDGYAAMWNLFNMNPKAPIVKIAPATYQWKQNATVATQE